MTPTEAGPDWFTAELDPPLDPKRTGDYGPADLPPDPHSHYRPAPGTGEPSVTPTPGQTSAPGLSEPIGPGIYHAPTPGDLQNIPGGTMYEGPDGQILVKPIEVQTT